MAHISLDIFSESLGMQTNVQIILPQASTNGEIGTFNKNVNGKMKCLYLLHGLSDDQTIWCKRTSIERYATSYGLCVVMPFGARSFYSNTFYNHNYYNYISKELPSIIESMFNVSSLREDRYLGGNSMGGYGALKIAINESDRYSKVFALSPVTDIYNKNFTETLKGVFKEEIPSSQDLKNIMLAHNEDKQKPDIYLTIGNKDFMIDDYNKFIEFTKSLKYNIKSDVTEGLHCWELWDEQVQNTLKWIFNK